MIAKRLENINKSIIRQIYDAAPQDAINLGLGEIQFQTPNMIRLKAKQVINQGEIFYTPNAGIPELRKSVAQYYNQEESPSQGDRILAETQNVCITNGAQEAIFAVLFSLVNPGDEILIADPTFLAYQTIAEMLGGKVKTFPLDEKKGFSFDIWLLKNQISEKTKILFLNHPSNPTGKAFTSAQMTEIIQICRQYHTILIVDEVYKDVFLQQKIASFWGYYENTIIISGLSKSFCMTGWRIGWILAEEQLLRKFTIAHQYISTCASAISQKAAIKAFSEQGQASILQLRKKLLKNYKFCLHYLKEYINPSTQISPDAAPYLMIKIHEEDISFCKKMAEKGLIVIPGSAFGQQSKGYIRISYALNQKKLRMGLKILSAHLVPY